MPSDTSHHRPRPSRPPHLALPASPLDHQQVPLPCPRCDSKNTKFCYYNNYNLAQPRHFCKSCRRYWTQGGTLRDIPVGGGTRKNTKRSRVNTTNTTTSATTATATSASYDPISLNPISSLPLPIPGSASSSMMMTVGNGGIGVGVGVGGGFTSLLNTQANGFLALNGFGLGMAPGYDDMGGFDIGKGAWPLCLPDIGEGTDSSGGGGGGEGCVGGGGATWQLGIGGDGGFGDSECLSWPELAMSTPRKGVK